MIYRNKLAEVASPAEAIDESATTPNHQEFVAI
jgi:hypothetical protein